MSFWYLATPYSKYPGGLEQAFAVACKQASVLIKAGVPVYSPIAHTHPIARWGNMDPLDHTIWLPADEPMMRAAKGLIIVRALSWESSYGMAEERKMFVAWCKPIIFMDPGRVPHELSDD